ncbi:Homologous to type II secretory pathway protein LspG [Legionella beliardensis]|uniref:Homologous to type II secretory pathway protein LspG n=1 Tax=Legionella beliardensis TaxID=91822 RepID=A0A378I424_9GAMM|nr:type II secretion system protein GspG [Legionella beliardensis]STX29743.1 Homologous to type II secretory pathway protein LspG [Legionella beliardensis]
MSIRSWEYWVHAPLRNIFYHEKGFTMIEILLVIIIFIFFIVIFALPGYKLYHKWFSEASSPITKEQQQMIQSKQTIEPALVDDVKDAKLLAIENALNFYKLDNGFYPTSEQGLIALVKKPVTPPVPQHWVPYLKSIPASYRLVYYKNKPRVIDCSVSHNNEIWFMNIVQWLGLDPCN